MRACRSTGSARYALSLNRVVTIEEREKSGRFTEARNPLKESELATYLFSNRECPYNDLDVGQGVCIPQHDPKLS